MDAHWNDILRPVVAGRRWLLGLDVLAAATPLAARLHRLGAERSFAVAATEGVGPPPDPAQAECLCLGVPPAPSMLEGLRRGIRALAELPAEVRARVDGWDPDRSARAISTIFSDGAPIAGRAQLGPRPLAWQALEDKTVIDALWDASGVPRAPSRVVPLAELAAAARALGGPVVVAADNQDGFHGGGELTRAAFDAGQLEDVRRAFAGRTRHVRVMPFLEGIPCSIHGWVLPEGTLAFRPMEMVVLRRPDGRFLYAGTSGWWDAPPDTAAEMRALARRVGEHLRASVGFRGAFTVDGVATADGFRPTELNPRVGAALPRLFHAIDTDVNLLNRACVEGLPLDWRGQELEDAVMAGTERSRSGHGMAALPGLERAGEATLAFDGPNARPCAPEDADAVVRAGPGPMGSILQVSLVAARTPIGPSAAGRVAAAIRWADAAWALGVGPVEPATG